MKKLICYFNTLKEFDMFLAALFKYNALFINHDYQEQKSYIKENKLYEPIKCTICGDRSISWRQL